MRRAKIQLQAYLAGLLMQFRDSRPEAFCKNGVVKNFAKFTQNHLCPNLRKLQASRIPIKKETCFLEFCKVFKGTYFEQP